MAKFSFVKGETSIILPVFIQDSSSTTGAGLGSLDQTSSIVGGYMKRGGTGVALAVDENVTTEGTYEAPTSAAQVRIGTPANMRTGDYELHFHNDLFTTADYVMISLGGASNMAEMRIEIQLTDFDLNTSIATIVDNVWDEVLTGATHNTPTTAGRRLRQIDAAFEVHGGTALAGGASTITLDVGASAVDDIYNGDRIVIIAGTGAQEHGIVIDYDGGDQIATMSKAWVVQPDTDSEFVIVPADVDVETWANTVVTAAQLQILDDWINTGRLDLLLDATLTSSLANSNLINTVLVDTGTTIPALLSVVTGTADSGSSTTLVDATLTEGDDYWNGALINFTSGSISGQTRIITDFDAVSDTITFAPAATDSVGTNTYRIIPFGVLLTETQVREMRQSLGMSGSKATTSGGHIDTLITNVPDIVSLANIQTQVDTALVTIQLDHLINTAAPAVPHADSHLGVMFYDGTTAYDRTTDSLQVSAGVLIRGLHRGIVASSNSGNVTLEVGSASFVDNIFNGDVIRIISGTAHGQARVITNWVSSTQVATIIPDWTTDPVAGDEYDIIHGSVNTSAIELVDPTDQINTEVDNALNVTTYPQPGQENPAATTTIREMLAYLYKGWRNKMDASATLYRLYADDGTTVDQQATLTSDASSAERAEMVSG